VVILSYSNNVMGHKKTGHLLLPTISPTSHSSYIRNSRPESQLHSSQNFVTFLTEKRTSLPSEDKEVNVL
jgi:hypothetical protein